MGYEPKEIVGKHHKIFCDPAYVKSEEYASFWRDLQGREELSGEFPRVGKAGNTIWISATYAPVMDPDGKGRFGHEDCPDITARKASVDRISNVIEELGQRNLTVDLQVEPGGGFDGLDVSTTSRSGHCAARSETMRR